MKYANIMNIKVMPGAYDPETDIFYEHSTRGIRSPPPATQHQKHIISSDHRIRLQPPTPVPCDNVSAEHCISPLPTSPPPHDAIRSVTPTTAVPEATVTLSPAQIEVLEKVRRGESVFFTGSAGTGKSVLLREIIKAMGGAISEQLAITASTGIAAVNIGGTTLHSFAGIGLGKEPAEKLAGKILGQKTLRHILKRWRRVHTLIIDEISMIDGSLFDKLEYMARTLRYNPNPFGGIQLIISGDFCQLPPVPDRYDGAQVPVTFAFDAETWSRCLGGPVVLTKVFRQKEQKFVDMLNEMRFGRLDKRTVVEFKKLSRPVKYEDDIVPTELFPLRREVEDANKTRLARLSGTSHRYIALDMPGHDIRGNRITQEKAEKLLERLVAVKEVVLKVGAQVMLIKNTVQGHLINGSLGKVIDFKSLAAARESHTQIAEVDDKTSPSSSSSVPTKKMPTEKLAGDRVWPVVRFINGQELLCVPASFSLVDARGEEEAKRDQIPLILAWALSVHKSQGQTLERVKVDLGRTFEKGQAYVALSRATNMNTLQVLNFDSGKVMAHPRVLQWHEDLQHEQHSSKAEDFWQEMDSDEAKMAYFAD